ncbi:hypothetical protein H9Q09_12100 [Aurantimonas sp. DM33-3]|uniref:hypothetical protein n=1 Tax=Aurantimonas sp. DM33-3 TaxID=2766955 RepID=UPI0016528DBA|nr:hypothetical protein [Aurantimonas sp. DM33-3]MBC6716951.1 hypothetical protein [Aurantimonas sp. DM33-3]
MAERARLTPPPVAAPAPVDELTTGSVRVSEVAFGSRRLEAGTYLTEGYGIQSAILARAGGWEPLSSKARVWQPSRLKGIQVDSSHGTSFLAATQVFDVRPIPRKWLALQRTREANDRFVAGGTILVTCSGTVGRATIAFDAHSQILISHDLLRVAPLEEGWRGWLYAFLRAPRTRKMMRSQHYGHMIKHLEPEHLDALPMPLVDEPIRRRCDEMFDRIVALRNEAHQLILNAEDRYASAVGPLPDVQSGPGFSVSSRSITGQRRRLDATYSAPTVEALRRHLAAAGQGTTSLRGAGYQAWLPSRFQRVPAKEGVELVSSSVLFEINSDPGGLIADRGFGDPYGGRVQPGWLLIARSGQNYGLVGQMALATEAHRNKVISDHVIRLAPGEDPTLRVGYVMVALTHPTLGRPLMKALPTGSSIPSIDYEDVLDLDIVRLQEETEGMLADMVERACGLRAEADAIENALGELADAVIVGEVAAEG